MQVTEFESIEERLPSTLESNAAKQLRRVLFESISSGSNHRLNIRGQDGSTTDVALAPTLVQLVINLLDHIENGDAVQIVPITRELSTPHAADILNVSHSYLLHLVKTGTISSNTEGTQRSVMAADLFEYKRTRSAKRASALDELAAIDKEYI